MKIICALGLLLFVLSACGPNRVLVRDCQDMVGMPGQKNCQKVKDL